MQIIILREHATLYIEENAIAINCLPVITFTFIVYKHFPTAKEYFVVDAPRQSVIVKMILICVHIKKTGAYIRVPLTLNYLNNIVSYLVNNAAGLYQDFYCSELQPRLQVCLKSFFIWGKIEV